MHLLLLLAGLLTVAPVAARAQNVAPGEEQPVLTMDRRGPGLVEAAPGEAITVPFMVTSSAPDTLDLAFRAHLPDGWRLHGGDQPHRLGPGETHLRLLSISAEASATARTSVIRLDVGFASAGGPGQTRMVASDSVRLHLPPHPSISLTRLAARDVAVAGQQYGASVAVVNSGNVPLELDFTAKSSGGYRTTVTPERVTLAPSARQQLDVHVWSTPGIGRARREVLRIEARSPDLPGPGPEEIAIGLDLLPAVGDSGDPYHRFPLHVRLSASPGAGEVPPFRVSGSGPLFDDATARLDFLFQGPAVARSLTGTRDEYRIRYRSDRVDLRLGDHAFAATPLTGYATRATGGGASVSLGALRLGGHHAVDRQSSAHERTSAASLGVAAGSLDVEARWQDRTGPAGGSLVGGRGRLNLHRGLSLDAELVGATERSATGHRLDASGQLPALSYRVTYRDTDPELPVRDAGMQQHAAHVQLRPFSWLQLFGGIEQTDRRGNGISGDLRMAETSYQRKAGLDLGGRLTLEMTERRRRSTLRGREVDYASRTVRARFGLRGGFWSLRPRLEVGRGTDPVTRDRGLAYGGALDMTIRAGDRFSLSGVVEHHFGADIDPVYDARWSRARVALSSAITASTRLNVGWTENRRPHPLQGSSRMLEVIVKHRLPFGHEMEAHVRSAPPRNTPLSAALDDPMAHLSYGIPLSVPVSRSSAAGQLLLSIVDESTHAPVEGVRVTAGGTFGISDREGKVRMGGLPPGDHEVQFDRATVGVARISADADALEVTIRAGRETEREIRLVTGSSLSGSVRLLRFERDPRPGEAESPELVDAGTLAGATVEVSRGEQVYRVATDSEGGYTFLGLRPGTWTVRVVGDLPEWHVFEPETVEIAFGPQEARTADFRVVPVVRGIRMIVPTPGR